MSDIFISYANADRPRVKVLVDALAQQGWSVWWDRTILAGKTWDRAIEDALSSARCAIVVWTQHSVDSEWVRTEAAEGNRRGILVPVLLDRVNMPLEFRRIQAADLVGWSGAPQSPEFGELARAVSEVLAAPPALAAQAAAASAGAPPAVAAVPELKGFAEPAPPAAKENLPVREPLVRETALPSVKPSGGRRGPMLFAGIALAGIAGLSWYFLPGTRPEPAKQNAPVVIPDVPVSRKLARPAASGGGIARTGCVFDPISNIRRTASSKSQIACRIETVREIPITGGPIRTGEGTWWPTDACGETGYIANNQVHVDAGSCP